jgi:hypothetical protein
MFGFTDTGLGLMQGSFQPETGVWHDRLSRVARLNPVQFPDGAYVPPFAFTYLEYDDGTAVLLRRADSGGRGRNYSHALVASTGRLRPLSLSLPLWSGWRERPSNEPLRAITADLSGERVMWREHMLDTMHTHRNHVTKILRRLVEEPERKLTVLHAEEDHGLPLLWICHEVLEPLFASSTSPFWWTYSTFEATDTDEHPVGSGTPRVVFLPELPAAGETSRNRVFLAERPERDSSWHIAESIVDRYLEDPGRWPTFVDHRLGKEPDVCRRLKSFHNGSSRAVTTRKSVPAQEPDRRDVERDQRFGRDEPAAGSPPVAQQESDYSSWHADRVLARLDAGGLTVDEGRALTARLREILAARQEPATCGVATHLRELERRLQLLVLIAVTVLLLAEIVF